MVWPLLGFCWWLSGKEFRLPIQEVWVDLWVGKIALEKEMVTHASILAWEISWTEELGWLWSSSVRFSRSVVSDSLQPHGGYRP